KSSFLEEEGDAFGVFEKGFAHILDSIPSEESTIEFSQVESIGDIILLIENLHRDILAFLDSKQTLKDFLERSLHFANTYLFLDEEADFFFKELKKITSLAITSTYLYSFHSFKRLFREIFSKRGSREKTYDSPPILFSSIETSPPIDKALFFIGLDGESFPKKSTYRSLNELENSPLYEKKASPAQKARYYLLQAIQTAKGAISFSYTANNPIDGKKRSISPLLEEINHSLLLPPPKVHPFLPYDANYFKQRHPHQEAYDLYLAANEKRSASPFTYQSVTKAKESTKRVQCKDLTLLARSPAGFFYNLSTRMYENRFFTPTMFDDSEFVLSYLDKAIITKSGAKEENASLDAWLDRGKLPTALFEKAATKELENSIAGEKKMVEKYLFSLNPYLHIQLDPNISAPIFKEATIFLPAITCKMQNATYIIEGEISNLTEKGILSFKKASKAECWKALPLLILLACLDTPIPLQIHFIKEGITKKFHKEKLRPLLGPLLSYYEKALESISPFMPEAIEVYAKEKSISFNSIKAKLLSKFHDPYLERAEPKESSHFEEEIDTLLEAIKEEEESEVL
nr:exodeoxyribonuclease V subunit gamma [bacterium]